MSDKEKIHVFIELLTDKKVFETYDQVITYITAAYEIIEGSLQIEGIKLFYDLENIKSFFSLEAVEIMQEDYIAAPSLQLWSVLGGLDNWRDNKKQQEECVYMLWDLENHKSTCVNDTSLAEITERMILGGKVRCLFLNIRAILINRCFIPIFKDCQHIDGLPEFINIDFVKDADSLIKWVEEHRLLRIFNLNPKHGENGVGNWGEASPLLCSRREAQALLNTAIYDKKTRNYYNFDQTHKKYIIFEDENTSENTYHGYHLDNENAVPNTIRKKFELIKQAHG